MNDAILDTVKPSVGTPSGVILTRLSNSISSCRIRRFVNGYLAGFSLGGVPGHQLKAQGDEFIILAKLRLT